MSSAATAMPSSSMLERSAAHAAEPSKAASADVLGARPLKSAKVSAVTGRAAVAHPLVALDQFGEAVAEVGMVRCRRCACSRLVRLRSTCSSARSSSAYSADRYASRTASAHLAGGGQLLRRPPQLVGAFAPLGQARTVQLRLADDREAHGAHQVRHGQYEHHGTERQHHDADPALASARGVQDQLDELDQASPSEIEDRRKQLLPPRRRRDWIGIRAAPGSRAGGASAWSSPIGGAVDDVVGMDSSCLRRSARSVPSRRLRKSTKIRA